MNLQTRIGQQSDSYVARRVAMDVLGYTKEALVVAKGAEVAKGAKERMDAMMVAYDGGKPLAYVLGYEWFDGHKFFVDGRVLIPRAETEELAMLASKKLLKIVKSRQKTVLLDVGTGSGCVGISIMEGMKKEEEGRRRMKKDVQCVLCDVSEGALEVAEENINRLCHSCPALQQSFVEDVACGVPDDQESLQLEKDPASSAGGQRIVTKQVDVMRLTDDDQGLDEFLEEVDEVVIVANLPYIPEGYGGVEDDVQTREPHLALYSGDDGLVHYRALIDRVRQKEEEGRRKKKEEGTKWTVWMEMMTEQAEMLKKEVGGHGRMWKVHETFHSNIVIVELVIEGTKE